MEDKERARRRFLKEGAAFAGLAFGGTRSAGGQTGKTGVPETQPKGLKDIEAYGERSRFVNSMRMSMGDDPFGLTPHQLTPLQDLVGSITPSSLHYVATHAKFYVPDIDPNQHRLMIHGMVDRPLLFTMDELRRFPFVSRHHYIECDGNRPIPQDKTVQEAAGRTSCSEWTGVPLALLLREAGVQNGASWIIAEGSENTMSAISIPLSKAMDDTLVAYGQNGEPVRPQQGFPLRLIVPGFEGIKHVKWLRRIKVTNEIYVTYGEVQRYTSIDPSSVALNFDQGPKSVITFPSGGQKLPGRGHFEISGLAWSGGGAVRRVEVSTDNGQTWRDAEIRGPAHRMAHTRFGASWNWNGEECMLLSRCTDELGQVQPTLDEFLRYFKISKDYLSKHRGEAGRPTNHILPWKVNRDGSVQNGMA